MIGYLEGEVCARKGCTAVIELAELDNCSCHINAPCGPCTNPREYCPECDWQAEDEVIQSESHIYLDSYAFGWIEHKPKVLDRTKIDYVKLTHSPSSQKVKGVFPAGTSMEEVRSVVNGTFGGRFEGWNEELREFTYIAYTD